MKLFIPLLAVAMLLKPIWPIVDYVVNYDYIVENLCVNRDQPMLQCNGKCHLAKQVADEEEKKEDNPYHGKNYSVEFSLINWSNEQNIPLPVFHCIVFQYALYSKLYSSLISFEILHPPQFI